MRSMVEGGEIRRLLLNAPGSAKKSKSEAVAAPSTTSWSPSPVNGGGFRSRSQPFQRVAPGFHRMSAAPLALARRAATKRWSDSRFR